MTSPHSKSITRCSNIPGSSVPGQHALSRREWLKLGSCGFGSLALAGLAANSSMAGPLTPRSHHFAPKAKRVIFLFMNGGPSQQDTFDYKPKLYVDGGKKGKNKQNLLAPLWDFSQHGQSGLWISELFPHLAKQADRLCVINSMQTDSRAHPLAIPLLHTGSFQFVRPSMGAWVLYGLGSPNTNLPGYITIKPTRTFGGPSNYGSAFLPSAYQATRIGWEGRPVKDAKISHLAPNEDFPGLSRGVLKLTQTLNRELLKRSADNSEIQGVIDSLNLSNHMEQTVPEVMDLNKESPETLASYGIGQKRTDDFGRQCLTARRLVEAGVRFVELANSGWDHHSSLDTGLPKRCEEVDQPIAALLADLQHRGLLDETLVFWGGEFGRQPETQILSGEVALGRDHNAAGYTVWMAGGGVRAGKAYGTTDEYGYEAVENPVHLHDLHATMLHLLGLDHLRLTYRYAGRDFRLTDVHGNVIHDLIA
ncbi:MAG TPA: DUF1501 domain-containing protein [Verrucomicrobiales bacterium]|nr:DUF1501 domain-containing protein [Verrucomicrobiales bacterium]HIL70400.1 DUF1501 domain-containing protein [Verrucomicrobiota bacterium]